MTSRDYWMALRGYLSIWLLINILGLGLLGFYFFSQAEVNDQHILLRQQLASIQQSASLYASYQQDVAFFQSRHLHWQQQDMAQSASARRWISTWPTLQQQGKLPHMQYEIQPAVTCDHQNCSHFWPAEMPPGLSMIVTPIKLRWSVSNESDVLDWLQQLKRSYAGSMLIRSCQWEVSDMAETIAAECELYWFDFPNLVSDQPA